MKLIVYKLYSSFTAKRCVKTTLSLGPQFSITIHLLILCQSISRHSQIITTSDPFVRFVYPYITLMYKKTNSMRMRNQRHRSVPLFLLQG